MASRQTEFRVVVLREPKTLYRACFGSDRAALRSALSSNYEIDRVPPHPEDLRASVLHMAVSGFDVPDGLMQLARKRPGRIGTHVATLDLQPDHGVCIADTGSAGHWSIWGIPAQLAAFVVEVVVV